MRPIRFRAQVVLATFLPLVLFGILSLAIAAYAASRIIEDLVLQRQTTLSQIAASVVAGNLTSHMRILEAVAGELGQYAGDAQRQQQILTDRATLLGDFDAGVGLLDDRGTAIAVTPGLEADLGINYAFRPYFQQARATGARVFSTVFEDYPSGTAVVAVAVPVQQSGAFRGVLAGQFGPGVRDWARDLDLLTGRQGVIAYLVDNAGTIIYHPTAARVGANLQSDPQLWRFVMGQRAASMLYQPAAGGEPMVVTLAPIPGVAWGLVLEEPWRAILRPVEAYQWATVGLMALGMLVALAALVVSLNRVLRPLHALMAEAQRVGEGKPFHPLPMAGPADVRDLLRLINQMVARLDEQQVALRDYAAQVLRGQEEERLRLSRDLHDETVQDLIGLAQRIDLYAAEAEEDPVAARARLRNIRALLTQTIGNVRRMSHNLRPSSLEDLGLAAALQVLTREVEQSVPQVRVRCEIVGELVQLPTELELTVFRIAQEALNNIRKHAATATRVNVALFYEDWGVTLMVEDDGSGFEAPDREALLREGHLGLAGMAERARLFGGELSVSSEPGEGTTVTLRIPLKAPQVPDSGTAQSRWVVGVDK